MEVVDKKMEPMAKKTEATAIMVQWRRVLAPTSRPASVLHSAFPPMELEQARVVDFFGDMVHPSLPGFWRMTALAVMKHVLCGIWGELTCGFKDEAHCWRS